MSTRISAGVLVTTLVFLIFIDMIPIDCKITNFSLYLLLYKSDVYFLFELQVFLIKRPTCQVSW